LAILELDALNKSFGGLNAVKNVTCDFPGGKITSVVGPNGAGKTTLFNLVTGFLKLDSGKVILEGKNITGLPSYRIVQSGMARTFQLVRVFSRLSLVDNVLLGDLNLGGNTIPQALLSLKKNRMQFKRSREEALAMLEYIGLARYANAMANDLSYGQQKLVEIARALMLKPKVLLVDEPFAGLSIVMIEKMLKLIDNIKNEGKTVILIEHNTEIVRKISEKIIVLNFGEVIASGPPDEAFDNKNVIDAYLGI
jgi:ABC-type branched-subunit amino acid transport system ATPase component